MTDLDDNGERAHDPANPELVRRALRDLFELGPSDPSAAAPSLRALFGQPPAFPLHQAEVDLDAEGDPLLVGVRSAGLLEERQIVASVGGLTVALDVARDEDKGAESLRVRGELIGTSEAAAVQMLLLGVEVALSAVDEFGEFRFDDLPDGDYELIVATSTGEVSVRVRLD